MVLTGKNSSLRAQAEPYPKQDLTFFLNDLDCNLNKMYTDQISHQR